MQEARATAALAEAGVAQQREAEERAAAARAQKNKAKKGAQAGSSSCRCGMRAFDWPEHECLDPCNCVDVLGTAWHSCMSLELYSEWCWVCCTQRPQLLLCWWEGERWKRAQAARRRSAMHSSYHCQRQAPRIKEECTWQGSAMRTLRCLAQKLAAQPSRSGGEGGDPAQQSLRERRPVSTRDILHRTAPSKQRLLLMSRPMAANSKP